MPTSIGKSTPKGGFQITTESGIFKVIKQSNPFLKTRTKLPPAASAPHDYILFLRFSQALVSQIGIPRQGRMLISVTLLR